MPDPLPDGVRIAPANGIEIAYETFGSPDDPTMLLVMGIGMQMVSWPPALCRMLADEGFHVVRFDNRDVGLSTHLDEAGPPDLSPLATGGRVTGAPYTFADMADDTVGLLDHLDVERAHLVGASLGGMIAQETALRHPERVLSLVSVMSTPSVLIGVGTREALAALMMPPATTEDGAAERAVTAFRVVGSPGYPMDEEAVADRAREAFRRSVDPAGFARQFAAGHASGDRSERLRTLVVPTLVMHGEDDPLIQPEGGRATAEAVPGARLVTFPGMGHDLPEALWPRIVEEVATHARTAS
jgi:pimeloyl-ACP methyl ester carboxylesterase